MVLLETIPYSVREMIERHNYYYQLSLWLLSEEWPFVVEPTTSMLYVLDHKSLPCDKASLVVTTS